MGGPARPISTPGCEGAIKRPARSLRTGCATIPDKHIPGTVLYHKNRSKHRCYRIIDTCTDILPAYTCLLLVIIYLVNRNPPLPGVTGVGHLTKNATFRPISQVLLDWEDCKNLKYVSCVCSEVLLHAKNYAEDSVRKKLKRISSR